MTTTTTTLTHAERSGWMIGLVRYPGTNGSLMTPQRSPAADLLSFNILDTRPSSSTNIPQKSNQLPIVFLGIG